MHTCFRVRLNLTRTLEIPVEFFISISHMARLVASSGMWIKRFNRGNVFEETCFERKTLIKQDASATCQIFKERTS